jgi:hypothetical protein
MDYMHGNARPISDRLEKFSRHTTAGCREWTGALIDGYGYIQMGSRTLGTRRVVKVHRLAWELECGPIPAGMCVCHRCDNRACFAIEHLFLGTNDENMADMARKGRANRKIGPDAVREVRRLLGYGLSHGKIAARLGLSRANVQSIKDRRAHAHVL